MRGSMPARLARRQHSTTQPKQAAAGHTSQLLELTGRMVDLFDQMKRQHSEVEARLQELRELQTERQQVCCTRLHFSFLASRKGA